MAAWPLVLERIAICLDTGALCRAANGDGELDARSLAAGTERLDVGQRLLELIQGSRFGVDRRLE